MKSKFISHRGNMKGVNIKTENLPEHIFDLLTSSIEVEIDVWLVKGHLCLGHDYPQYRIKEDFLNIPGLWCHAKNLEALTFMLQKSIHCFWHQEDDYTVTSRGYIWTYPDRLTTSYKSVIVDLSENWQHKIYECGRVCSDFAN